MKRITIFCIFSLLFLMWSGCKSKDTQTANKLKAPIPDAYVHFRTIDASVFLSHLKSTTFRLIAPQVIIVEHVKPEPDDATNPTLFIEQLNEATGGFTLKGQLSPGERQTLNVAGFYRIRVDNVAPGSTPYREIMLSANRRFDTTATTSPAE